MAIIGKVAAAIKALFGEHAEEAAKDSGLILRKRKFSASTLLQTLVLGYLKDPKASDESLAQMAAQCGVSVTPQAIEQRHTSKLVAFLQRVFQREARTRLGSDKALAPILERFTNVHILDGSTVSLPDEMKEQFAGCGGPHDSGKAALKLQTDFELRSGAVTVEVEQGRDSDGGTPRLHELDGKGSLRITDLGYFNVEVFAARASADEYFLSRLQFGTKVILRQGTADETPGEAIDLLPWLQTQTGPFVDRLIYLGQGKQLPCRMIAWRLPQALADARRRKVREEARRRGTEPSAKRLAWCDWTILVTNVPADLMTPAEAVVLYRARWQVELLFKRWKSQNLVAQLLGATAVRQMVRVWVRLLMSLVQHWLVIASVWGDPSKSLSKVCEAIREFAGRIASTLLDVSALERVLADLCKVLAKTCRRNPRSKPGTFELLNNVQLLDFRLT